MGNCPSSGYTKRTRFMGRLHNFTKPAYTNRVKQVLVIDESALFRESLLNKLEENEIDASAAVNGTDGISKLRGIIPDLLILDYNLSRQGCSELLKIKKGSPTLAPIPVIITAQQIDQKKILEMVPYNVRKVFTKPVKIDALLAAMQETLGVPFNIDKSPGIVEVHVNEDIIFIEITEGLNRDKLDLLKFKIIELVELYQIRTPKLIIMLSGFTLSPADGPNLQKLLTNILESSKAKQQNVRILTMDEFTKIFISKQRNFREIEVVDNLQYALGGLLDELHTADHEEKAVLIGDKVLSADNTKNESLQLRFEGDAKFNPEEIKDALKNLHVAAVDDDEVILELVKHTFSGFETKLSLFSDGAEFIEAIDKEQFDLVLLDLVMPRADGFAVLRELQDKNNSIPVIVLSGVSQRETVIRAFQMGTKSYLIKPLKPADIFRKILEILKVNF